MLSPDITTALQRAGLPVPDQARVDRIGFSAQESAAIDRHLRRLAAADPMSSQIRGEA